MAALVECSNTVNTCLLILDRKGWRCWYDESLAMYGAEKDGWDFLAMSPAGLLGVISIYEDVNPTEFREYGWRADGDEDYFETIPNSKPDYVSVQRRSDA